RPTMVPARRASEASISSVSESSRSGSAVMPIVRLLGPGEASVLSRVAADVFDSVVPGKSACNFVRSPAIVVTIHRPLPRSDWELRAVMKAKTKNRKSYKWRKKADSSPVAKGRRPKRHGIRNPKKRRHLGGVGL